MPVALFVCPHCEKHAEVQVTSVTRSRQCPHCGEIVVLQVGGKDKGKRRALLVAAADMPQTLPEGAKGGATPAYEPMPLEGDVLERMRFDPEVQAFRRRFIIGLASLAVVVVLIVVWNNFGGLEVESMATNSPPPVESTEPSAAPAPAKGGMPVNTVGMRRSTAGDADSNSNKLVFELPQAKAGAAPAVAAAPEPAKGMVLPAAPKAVANIPAHQNGGGQNEKVMLPASDPRVQAAAVVERFLLANNIDAMLSTVADRQKVEPFIRRYIEKHPIIPADYDKMTISNGAGPTGERTIIITLKDGREMEALVLKEDDRSVVDWPSFVAWSDMEWAQFMNSTPVKPVLFRVIAQADKRFDNAFADEKTLACLRLIDPSDNASSPIYAYVEKSSVIGQEVEFLMRQAEGKPTKLTLHLKYPADPMSKDQVWIENVLASGWMVPRNKATAQAN